MAVTNNPRQSDQKPVPQGRDVPGCIKYVLLVFLLILLAAEIGSGEIRFSNLAEMSGLTWLVRPDQADPDRRLDRADPCPAQPEVPAHRPDRLHGRNARPG